jgi:hypothetical protein
MNITSHTNSVSGDLHFFLLSYVFYLHSHFLNSHTILLSYYFLLPHFLTLFSLSSIFPLSSFFTSSGVSTSSTSLKRKADDAAGKGVTKKGAKAAPAKKAGSKPGPKKR